MFQVQGLVQVQAKPEPVFPSVVTKLRKLKIKRNSVPAQSTTAVPNGGELVTDSKSGCSDDSTLQTRDKVWVSVLPFFPQISTYRVPDKYKRAICMWGARSNLMDRVARPARAVFKPIQTARENRTGKLPAEPIRSAVSPRCYTTKFCSVVYIPGSSLELFKRGF